jgi:hypothetical protein
MLARCLFFLLWCSLLSVGLCFLGFGLTYLIQGDRIAIGLVKAWIFDFDGVIVGALGYGLMLFVRSAGRTVLGQLDQLLILPDELKPGLVAAQHRAISWWWANLIAVPTTLIGAGILWNCGYPLTGFAQVYLAVCSSSIYYVATNILAHFLFTLAMFNRLEAASDSGVDLGFHAAGPRTQIRIETIDFFFVLTSTMGIFAIYAGFRGTLTANFENTPEIFRDLLILPLILYLPATLCYSLYPRYVLRKIAERETIRRIEETLGPVELPTAKDVEASLKLRKLVLEVREGMLREHRAPPLLGLKDAPSLTLSLVILVQFIWHSDKIVSDFLSRFLH